MPSPVQDLLPFARELAAAAGDVVMHYFRNGFQVDIKTDRSPVTTADREAELRMRDLINQRFPDHGVLGEEFPPHQPDARYVWVLDPIDGTANFVARNYLFGNMAALLEDGQPILGFVNHPAAGELFIGDNQTAWRNEDVIHVSATPSVEDALLLVSEHLSVERYQNGVHFEDLIRRVREYRGWGGCHGFSLVAQGSADISLEPFMHPWDRLPLIPLIRGAGGIITDWRGNDPVSNDSTVATNGRIHEAVLRAIEN
jgi:histidinol phosphatase-like enzyme (inositol monophosphatase family)